MPERRRSRWRWVWVTAAAIALLVLAAVARWAIFVRSTQPDAPGEFYSAPDPLPEGPPGTIVRSEVIDGFRSGATAYRVLDGNPTAVSGFVLVPDGEPPLEGRRVVAYTHGTVGVASDCAPSLVTKQEMQPLFVEGGDDLLEAGHVVAASDYQGLGTPGPHPYLVGDVEGDADPIVAAEVTERLADKLCAAGETVDLRLLSGVWAISRPATSRRQTYSSGSPIGSPARPRRRPATSGCSSLPAPTSR